MNKRVMLLTLVAILVVSALPCALAESCKHTAIQILEVTDDVEVYNFVDGTTRAFVKVNCRCSRCGAEFSADFQAMSIEALLLEGHWVIGYDEMTDEQKACDKHYYFAHDSLDNVMLNGVEYYAKEQFCVLCDHRIEAVSNPVAKKE